MNLWQQFIQAIIRLRRHPPPPKPAPTYKQDPEPDKPDTKTPMYVQDPEVAAYYQTHIVSWREK